MQNDEFLQKMMEQEIKVLKVVLGTFSLSYMIALIVSFVLAFEVMETNFDDFK